MNGRRFTVQDIEAAEVAALQLVKEIADAAEGANGRADVLNAAHRALRNIASTGSTKGVELGRAGKSQHPHLASERKVFTTHPASETKSGHRG